MEWEERDEIKKAAKEWMTKANEANVEQMRQDNIPTAVEEDNPSETHAIWQALADCPITLTMSKILNLVLRFR